MEKTRVMCTNCGRSDFFTTDKFNRDEPVNGSMVECTLLYAIDWLMVSSTKAVEMLCPECLSPLVIKGELCLVDWDYNKEMNSFDAVIDIPEDSNAKQVYTDAIAKYKEGNDVANAVKG